ncbi:class I SAM-dependent methyltransferase [Curtanaerobium respiraculi]|uniref:class I SAM-dependent methyltransferase n=1 Tax=Curtanaerobium respiraculi TaxID=2949669 RepID=UPI0024B38E2A|nr:class I SAM-dependent methyltransferase [Curtanaerobium respiraculi]
MTTSTFLNLDPDTIIGQWRNRSLGGYANASTWDAAAEKWAARPVASWDDDPFLKMLADEVDFSRGLSVLDIGCGAGLYSLALAARAERVTGTDISPKMIEAARKKAVDEGIGNATFEVGDFAEGGSGKRYDLVIAHMTPAVRDGRTFEKMANLANEYIYVAKPCRRHDAVLHDLMDAAGFVDDGNNDDDLFRMMCIVWAQGLNPSLRHYTDEWRNTRSLEEARDFFIEKSLKGRVSDEGLQKADARLEELAVDGTVEEVITTEVYMMGWRV